MPKSAALRLAIHQMLAQLPRPLPIAMRPVDRLAALVFPLVRLERGSSVKVA